jgi:tRNA threonylcarbamoyladenosine biosynthesis protein TsaE
MPFILKDADDTMALGQMLAQAMDDSSVRDLYLFADLGGGKTTLTRGFVSALPGGEDAEVASPSFTLCNIYPTRPEVLHADLYRLSEGAFLPEDMEELMEEGNALLVLEWPEYLARERYAGERLEVRLVHQQGNIEELFENNGQKSEHVTPLKSLDNADKSCKSFRLATLEAHGPAAEALLGSLLPRLSQRFMPVKA